MDYESASVEAMAAHFDTVTRQRVQQILKKYQLRENAGVVDKIQQAKKLVKASKYLRKNGFTLAERKRCDAIWAFLQKRVGKLRAYEDCTIAFASLDHFREWASRQVGFGKDGFEMDKDILVKGNRVYSPETCVFIPQELNVLFSGCYNARRRGKYPIGVSFNKGSGSFVAQMSSRQDKGLDKYLGSFPTVEEAFACYKAAKEAKIKRLAEKWRDQIDPRAYAALVSRTVEWSD